MSGKAALAWILGSALLYGATSTEAGEGRHGPVVIVHERVPWYHQHPWAGTGPGYYYSQHPDHIPAWPKRLSGYAVPIYETRSPDLAQIHRASLHADWCAARYRSYDTYSDTFAPRPGVRRACRSPFW